MRLVGRERELAELARGLAGQERSVAFIVGRPGIGKSALLRAQRLDGVPLLAATGSPLTTGIGYGVLRQLFSRYAHSARLGAAPFDGPGAAVLRFARGESMAGDREAMVYAVHWVLSSIARKTGVLLALDDVQWFDDASAEILGTALALAARDRVSVVAAAREVPREEYGPLIPVLYDIADAVVTPSPLGTDDIAELLGVDAARAEQLRELSGGVPFELLELAASPEQSTPPRVVEWLSNQLARRGEDAWRVARAAAVLEAAVPAQLAQLAGVAASELDRIVAALLADGVLERRGESLAPAHPLVQEAVLSSLGTLERSEWHERAAQLLHRAGAPLDAVAAHLRRTEPGDDAWRSDVMRQAAARALAGSAYAEATGLLERVLREPSLADAERAEVLGMLGRVRYLLNDPAGAVAAWRESLPLVDDSALRAMRHADLGDALYLTGDRTTAEAVYREALDTLLAAGWEQTSPLAIDVTVRLGQARLERELRTASLPDDVLRAVAARPAVEDGRAERRLFAIAAMSGWMQGTGREKAASFARRAWGNGAYLEEGIADDPITYWLTLVFYLSGQDELGLALLEGTLDDARRRNLLAAELTVLACRGAFRFASGDLRGALEDLAVSADRSRLTPWIGRFSPSTLHIRGSLLAGDAESAAATAGIPLWGHPTAQASDMVGKAEYALAVGDFAEASHLATQSGRLEPIGGLPWLVSWRAVAATIALQTDDPGGARELLDEERSLLDAVGVPAPARVANAMLTSQLDPERGRDELARLRRMLGVRHRWQHAVIAERLADLADGPDDRQRLLSEALLIGREQGMRPLVARVSALLGETGSPAAPQRASLTASEDRVVRLAAAGLSNSLIARELFVTPKTVEFHLSNVYRKLGITSRSQLAGVLSEPPDVAATSAARAASSGTAQRESARQS